MSRWVFMGSTTSPDVVSIAGFDRPVSAIWSEVNSSVYILQRRSSDGRSQLIKLNPTTDALELTTLVPDMAYPTAYVSASFTTLAYNGGKIYIPIYGSGFDGLEVKVYDVMSDTFDASVTSSPYDSGVNGFGGGNQATDLGAGEFFVCTTTSRVARFSPSFYDLGSAAAYNTGLGGSGASPQNGQLGYHTTEGNMYYIALNGARYGTRLSNPSTWTAIGGWTDASTFGPRGTKFNTATGQLLYFNSDAIYTFASGAATLRHTFSGYDCGSPPILAPNGRVYFSVIDTGATSRIYSYDPVNHVIVGQSNNSVNLNSDCAGACYCPLNNNAYFPNFSAVNPSVVRRIPCVF